MQGYLISEPLSFDAMTEFPQWNADRRWRTPQAPIRRCSLRRRLAEWGHYCTLCCAMHSFENKTAQETKREEEARLVASVLAGHPCALAEFYRRYAALLAIFVKRNSRLDTAAAQDVVQLTLIKSLRGLNRFRGDAAIFSWMCAICRNEIATVARTTGHLESQGLVTESTGSYEPPSIELEPEEWAILEARRSAVRDLLRALPRRYAVVLEMKYGRGLSSREIAVSIGTSRAAAQSTLKRARDAFRAKWNGSTHN